MIARAAAALALAALFWLPGAGPAAAVCGVYDPWPCVPEIQYPLGGDLRRTLVSASSDADEPELRQQLAQRPATQCPPKDPPPKNSTPCTTCSRRSAPAGVRRPTDGASPA